MSSHNSEVIAFLPQRRELARCHIFAAVERPLPLDCFQRVIPEKIYLFLCLLIKQLSGTIFSTVPDEVSVQIQPFPETGRCEFNGANSKMIADLPLPKGCKPVHACLDYRAFVFDLRGIESERAYQILCKQLRALGKPQAEMLGVTYVYAKWGFIVIPGWKFPDLKVAFFRNASEINLHNILAAAATIIHSKEEDKSPALGQST